jgi:SAM-dependent methyltransferase
MAPNPAANHYENLLAEHYTWMFGASFDQKVSEQRALLELLGVSAPSADSTGVALDLGCGSGFQSVALADIGFREVIAVDTSAKLLAELDAHRDGRPIRTLLADLSAVRDFAEPESADMIACMGDTLTHLPGKADVCNLFADSFRILVPGGTIVLTFRDLTHPASGLDRFIPVRSDADRIMTCFLEYESPETVVVHDLIHVRSGSDWALHKSSYRKLRLAPKWVCDQLTSVGFRVERNEQAGRLWATTAVKKR